MRRVLTLTVILSLCVVQAFGIENATAQNKVIGAAAGVVSATVSADESLEILVNITNTAGVAYNDIANEWFWCMWTVGGVATDMYLLTDTGLVAFSNVTDLSSATYSFAHSSDTLTIGTFILSNALGMTTGDVLTYGYAYSLTPVTDLNLSTMVIENFATVNIIFQGKVTINNAASAVSEVEQITIDPNESTLTVTNPQKDYKIGDVLIGNESDPFIKKVVSVSDTSTNEVILETEQAAIEDVIEEGSFSFSITPNWSQATVAKKQGYLYPQSLDYSIKPDGTIELSFDLFSLHIKDGEIDWSNSTLFGLSLDDAPDSDWNSKLEGDVSGTISGKLKNARFKFLPTIEGEASFSLLGGLEELHLNISGNVDYDILVEFSLSAGIELGYFKKLFPTISIPFVVLVGVPPAVVPVHMTIELDLNGGFNLTGEIDGIFDLGFNSSYGIKVDIDYVDDGNSSTDDWTISPTPDFNFDPKVDLDVGGIIGAEVFLEPTVTMRIYKIIGPYVYLHPYFLGEMEASLTDSSFEFDLWCGVSGGVGVNAKAFTKELFDYNWDVFNFKKSLYHKTIAGTTAPTASITTPSDNSTYDEGDTVTFSGSGYDDEDGTLSGNSLVWTSSLDGQIGTGDSFSTFDLSVGTHTITLTATDSESGTGSVLISVTINSSSIPLLNISPLSLDFGTSISEISFEITNTGAGNLSWTISENETWLSCSSDSGSNDETIIVTVDRGGLAYGSYEGDIDITSNGSDVAVDVTMVVGNGSDGADYTNTIGQTFVLIPAGTFTMGSPDEELGRSNNETQHQVTLNQSYYMQTTEVTQAQWEALMGTNLSIFSGCPNCPVEYVSWNNAQEFIGKLNQKEGTDKYRLPTEAEWENAARAGSATAFANGDNTGTSLGYDPNLDQMGWYIYNSNNKTHEVAQKQPNAWGLYDMHGNVREWVQDWYGSYLSDAVTDPEGPSSGSYRVVRGGSWSDVAGGCRSAFRSHHRFPGFSNGFLGFRLLRTP